MNQPDISQLLYTASKACLLAGQKILDVYNNATDFAIEEKKDNTPLTIADRLSHEEIVRYLARESALPILSEEGQKIAYNQRKNWRHFWLVDPLDGTKEFIKRNGEFTVNIALISYERAVAGFIYVPVSDTLYCGAESLGSWKIDKASCLKIENGTDIVNNGQALPITKSIPEDQIIVVASRSHKSEQTQDFISQLEKQYQKVEILSKGSSLKICMVAEGQAQIYPRFGPTMEWDVAAGHGICQGANISLVDSVSYQELTYNKENLLNPWFIVASRNYLPPQKDE